MMKAASLGLLIILLLSGCTGREELSETAEQVKGYLEEHGYEIVSYEGDNTYEVTLENLKTVHGEYVWSVQRVSPESFVGKTLVTEEFLVRNHPLDRYFYGRQPYYLDSTQVTVYLYDGDIIGGTSFPAAEEPLDGVFYSLDGKNTTEIHGSYQSWYKNWNSIITDLGG
ncbi:hypothetical protein [Evansella clarkii]|jgi:hypothetical protein|uniref:hypothetical protein n=1 Tax=Evansella clarkii TaxID=79879 RepID=UPI001066FD41|nr:hypothetical protein [Evansella clarkii]